MSLFYKQSHKINAVFNLQELGEHPLCGDGVIPSTGFSYSAEDFSDRRILSEILPLDGIFFFHFGWKDMTATDFETMLRIMDLMDFSLRDGKKVAVHCHAGRGRTLLVICSWMIFRLKMPAADTISLAKAKRKKVLTKKSQIKFLENFERYLLENRRVFNELKPQSLHDIIRQQKKLASSEYREKIKYCPLILVELSERIEILITNKYATALQAITSFINVDENIFKNKWDKDEDRLLETYKNKLNNMNYDDLSNIYDLRIYSNLLLDFFDGLSLPVVTFDTIKKITEALDKGQTQPAAFASLISRTEYQIISHFAHILNICRSTDPNISKLEEWYGHRVALSLLLLRKKFDKSFVKKTLLSLDGIDNPNVKILSNFIILLSKASDEEILAAYQNVYNTIRPKIVNPLKIEAEPSKTDVTAQTPTSDRDKVINTEDLKAPSGNITNEESNKL